VQESVSYIRPFSLGGRVRHSPSRLRVGQSQLHADVVCRCVPARMTERNIPERIRRRPPRLILPNTLILAHAGGSSRPAGRAEIATRLWPSESRNSGGGTMHGYVYQNGSYDSLPVPGTMN
jgi:hypothetical protein